MSNVTSAVTQAIRGKIGWNRIAVAISLLIVAIAAVALFRLFRDIEPDKVVAAFKYQSIHSALMSAGFVMAGYFMLTCYELFALRTIGCSAVPYRVAAFASFTSYAIGHNLGATVFTSAAIRYRVYSPWGLGVVDVARIAFITGLTYCLGSVTVLGVGILGAPKAGGAILHLPAAISVLIGFSALAVIVGYTFWLSARARPIGRAPWQIVLPCPRSTFLQIGLGSMDLIFVALAMYSLLPAQPPIDFLDLLVIFVAAMLIGVVSHAPGSLGVIEAAMFVNLPQFQKEELLVSLVTFRILYFVLPLLLAAVSFGLRECWIAVARNGRPS